MTDSLSIYEAWVRGLRAWRQDPLTDLTALPPLREDSFPPATYQRLLVHLNDAVNQFMKRWQDQLVSGLGAAQDDHARARALVDARDGLAHRLLLARHSSFPEQIRNELSQQAEQDIRSLQAQLEDDAANVAAASSASNRPQREATLRLIRVNALTAVLDPGFVLPGGAKERETRRSDHVEAPPLSHAPSSHSDFVPRRPPRRIFNPNA